MFGGRYATGRFISHLRYVPASSRTRILELRKAKIEFGMTRLAEGGTWHICASGGPGINFSFSCIYREMTAPLNYRARGKALTREIAKKQDFTLVHGELAILAGGAVATA